MSSAEAPRDNVRPKDYQEKFKARRTYTEYTECVSFLHGTVSVADQHPYSPCEDASKASLKCMDHNEYNRDRCIEFFLAYRECKKEWINKRKEDRQAGRPAPH
ncbi:hypothetical protein F5I97DRAFT_1838455 [Phlebopus sp. FC_14]|nr:hypothetical protein F5I97DRAFT_1838455 [Phlebopus sp. FC_14]